MAKSGVESLIDALRASGANVDDKFGNQGNNNGQGGQSVNSQANGSSTDNKKGSQSSQSGNGGGGAFNTIQKAILEKPIVERVQGLSKKGKIILVIILLIILGIAYWWFHPPINFQCESTWIILLVLIALPLFLFFRSRKNKYESASGSDSKGSSKSNDNKTNGSPDTKKAEGTQSATSNSSNKEDLKESITTKTNKEKAKLYRKLYWIPLAFVILWIIGMLISASFFPGNAEKYASVLKTENLDFKQDISEVDYTKIPIIDRDTARVLGTKEMGTIPDYVSQFEISNLYSQINFQNKPVRVSPLLYADLFKWLTNREAGIPAYCVIDMATQDAKIVRVSEVDGTENQGIKYSESEPLARNIHRYIQLKYPFYIFDEFSFEIDEKGHPWWICPVQTRTIGLFGGKTISRAIMCDAVTGECIDLDINDLRSQEWDWVDRVYPSNLVIEQYNWSGKYSKGWLNSWLGQSGVVKTTPGTAGSSSNATEASSSAKSLGYNYIVKDDDVWVYTGVTSATSDTSIVGFILINQRTAESHFYSISGATEVSAMESAEGQVQHLRYNATFPILINIGNQPTYFIALKDAAGLVKKFAMIDIQRYQNVALGDTVAECQKAYQALLTREGIDISSGQVTSGMEAQGTITNIAQAVYDGNSHYFITLAGDNHIYDFALPGFLEIVRYKVGDQIHIHYSEAGKTCTVSSID